MTTPSLSDRLRARPRKTYPVDLQDALGLPEPAPCLVRIARSGEDDDAIVGGFAYVERATKPLGAEVGASARADADLLGDAKSKEALARAFRDLDGEPLFPDAAFIRDNLSTDEAAALVNIVAEIRRVDARVPVPDDVGVEAVLGVLASMAEQGHEAPGVALGPYQATLAFITVEAAVKLKEARAERDEARAELEKWRAAWESARGVPEGVPLTAPVRGA